MVQSLGNNNNTHDEVVGTSNGSGNPLDTTPSVFKTLDDNMYQDEYGDSGDFPFLRERKYGDSIKSRSNYQTMTQINLSGPPDLLHVGKYCGITSSAYEDDFLGEIDKHEDGYIGTYHYVNGIYHDCYYSIEKYIFDVMGIKIRNNDYYWDSVNKKETVVTYCSYNIFTKSDLRIKYVLTPNNKKTISIDKTFQILPSDSNGRKVQASIGKLNDFNWDDINVSSIIRSFQMDEPSKQLPGLINFSKLVDSKSRIINCLQLLVKYLSKGYLTNYDESYGLVTGCQNNNNLKTNHFRNNLTDTIIRICDLDYNGNLTKYTIELLDNLKDDWTWLKLRLLKNANGYNSSVEFVNTIHSYFKNNDIYTTHSCLILLEQIKFLISKQDYTNAVKLNETTIKIMPLDFECWYYLILSYTLVDDYENAFISLNSLPITINQNLEVEVVSGIEDTFSTNFLQKEMSEKTFMKYFPPPNSLSQHSLPSISKQSTGEIKKIWKDVFIFNPLSRHPIMGNKFYQTPIICKSVQEVSSIDGNLRRLTDVNTLKLKLSGHSANSTSSSMLDFTKKSTWGKAYNILSYIIAKIGWEEVMHIKVKLFHTSSKKISAVNNDKNQLIFINPWLEQLFLIIYEDLKTLMVITDATKLQNHSILQWELLGILGWNVKYNLKFTISSLITSFIGDSSNYKDIHYFNSVQILIIYDEFILGEVDNSQIDNLNDDYMKSYYLNKLILKDNMVFNTFLNSITKDYLTIDLILMILIKLISWNLRWYQFLPSYLVQKILNKLIIIHSSEFILSKMRIIFNENKSGNDGWFKKGEQKMFEGDDSIIEYFEKLFAWIEGVAIRD